MPPVFQEQYTIIILWLHHTFLLSFQITRQTKHILPHLARFCLVSTFFEDGLRMWVQWTEQREYMDISWGCGWFLATMFVVINLLGQLGGVAMVLFRFRVDIACVVLFSIVCLQVSFYSSSICLSLATFLVFLCARNYIHTSVNILYLVCPVFLPVLQHLHPSTILLQF